MDSDVAVAAVAVAAAGLAAAVNWAAGLAMGPA